MKILRIEIVGFGKWRQKKFDFTSGNQLIYGENEAGKSTIYQFIQAVLFGFPSKGKKKKDYTPKDGSAYGGRIWLEHPVHGEFIVERYKQQNRGKSKVTFDGQVGSDELLTKLIAPLTRELFQQVFTFQQEQLIELEHLREKELHDALISLGITGSSYVFQKRQEYYQQAQQLFKKKGQKLLINQKLNEWRILQEKIRKKQEQEAVYGRLIQDEQQEAEKQRRLSKKMEEISQQLTRYKQQELNFSLYEEWQSLKKNTSNQEPDEQLLTDLEMFINRYQQMNERLEELEASLERHSGMDQQSARYYFYLEQEEALKNLQQKQLTMEQLSNEWERLQIETRETASELGVLEQRWQWDRLQQPQEFLEEQEWQELYRVFKQLKEQETQLRIRFEVAKEQQQAIEAEINELEDKHPSLLQTQKVEPIKKTPWLVYIGALLIFIVGLFLAMPFKVLGFLVATGIIGYSLFQRKAYPSSEQHFPEIKGKWQEKLGQLDIVLAQLEEMAQTINQNLCKQQELVKKITDFSLKYSLGTMNTIEVMKNYGQEVADYQKLYAVFQRKQTREMEIQQQLAHYEASFDFTKEWLPIQDKALTEKIRLLTEFIQEMEQMKFARSYQQNTLLKQEINQLKKKQKILLQDFSDQLAIANLSYPSEVPAYLQKVKQTQQQKKRLEELQLILSPIFTHTITRTQLQVKLAHAKEQLKQLKVEEGTISEQRQRLQLQIEGLQQDGTLDELYQQESLKKAQLQELFQQWGGLVIAGTFLGDLSTELSERQLPQLLKLAGTYLGVLTNNHYQEILLMNDTLTLVDDTTKFPIYELSTGTKDQVIMAMRFAYLSLEANRSLCPIIIDDGWLHYDHQRKYRLAKLLTEFGRNYQVICLSSDQEMVSYYQELQQSVRKLEGTNNEKNS
ncbi:hypothetical protein E1H99_12690 [Enterococcus hirae]|nr:hypothetical protein E1H99_12690 [Enterococcus hirae]